MLFDEQYERRSGGTEYRGILSQLLVSGNFLCQCVVHALISVYDLLLKVQTEIRRIDRIVQRRATDIDATSMRVLTSGIGSLGLETETPSVAVMAFGVRMEDDTAGGIEVGLLPTAPLMLIRVVTTE